MAGVAMVPCWRWSATTHWDNYLILARCNGATAALIVWWSTIGYVPVEEYHSSFCFNRF